jgi:FKBP-type peptidyl-prolyl cis-trans isomerase
MNNGRAATLTFFVLAAIAISQETPIAKTPPSQKLSVIPKPTVVAQRSAKKSQAPKEAAQANSQAAPIKFNSSKEKVSYALGVELAAGVKYQRMDVDLGLIIRGMRDAFAKDVELAMAPKEIADTLRQYAEVRKRGLEHALQMVSEKNQKAGVDFVAENAKKDGVVSLPSGLQYKILNLGDGRKPSLDDSVECNYRGTLLDGTEFDSSYKTGKALTFPMKGVIKGWQEALQLMPVGSKWQLFVPPQLAYGERGAGGVIGPNATLIFEVELVSISDKAQTASAK